VSRLVEDWGGGEIASSLEARLAMLGSERELLFESVVTVSVVDGAEEVVAVFETDIVRMSVEDPRPTRLGLEWEPWMVVFGSVMGGSIFPIPPREYCEYCQY
jgi:hypothetical protein